MAKKEGIPPKRLRFIEEYMVDLNGTQAAIRAGYSPNSAQQQAHDLLMNPLVAAEVARRMKEAEAQAKYDKDYVINNLLEIVERCMQRAPVMVRDGKEFVQAMDEEGRHVWQFNDKGANKALEMLGRHIAMFKDKVEVEVVDALANRLQEARERVKAKR